MRSLPGVVRRVFLSAGLALAAIGCGGTGSPAPTPEPTSSPTPAPAVSTAGLVLLLHMDEAAWNGTPDEVIDSSGGGHHGTASQGATTVTGGKFGRAGSFGSAGCVEIPDVPELRPTTQLTVSAWVLPNDLGPAPHGIIAKRIDYTVASAYALFFNSDGHLTADVSTEDNRFEAPTVFASGRWYHLAMVYDGGLPASNRVTLYVDGNPAAVGTENSPSIISFTSPLWVGCLPLTEPAQGLSGLLDEVAVWHRALGPTEIATLARADAPINK